jgi:flagellar basal-body rod protein FlgB
MGQGVWLDQINHIMSLLSVQHRAIANNIANANTPGFKAQAMDFNAELNWLLQRNHGLEAAQTAAGARSAFPLLSQLEAEPEIATLSNAPARTDGNTVNLEQAMVDVAEVVQTYQALSRVASKDLRLAQFVIRGGRG